MLKSSRNRADRRVNIVDLEAIESRVQSALLRTAASAGAFAELVTWAATANQSMKQKLRDLQFTEIDKEQSGPRAPRILVRSLDIARLEQDWLMGDTLLLDLKNWDMRMLYSIAG